MRKFILIDHSLKNVGGHHFDYSLHVLRAAQAMDFDTVLGSHRAFRRSELLPDGCRLFPVFPHTTYNQFTVFTASRGKLKQARAARVANGLFDHMKSKCAAAVSRTLEWLKAVAGGGSPQQRIDSFAAACRQLFRQIELRRGDLVFLTTLSELDLLGLVQFLRANPETRDADWHLQFHFNIFEGREPDYAAQADRLAALRERFTEAIGQVPKHRLNFYNTSRPLADQYRRFGVADFQPLAYPINPAFRSAEQGRVAGGPLRVTCAGAIRPEKGQHFLTNLLHELWPDYFASGKAQLVVQSKWSRLSNRPRLQLPLPKSSQSQMRQIQRQTAKAKNSTNVEPIVYVRHPLETKDYFELIRNADIGLLMYDSERYYARRAGVLCELLMAGVPVIVPAGCWLAEQIAEPIFAHLDELPGKLSITAQTHIERLSFSDTVTRIDETHAVPDGATDLLIRFRREQHGCEGTYVRVSVEQLDGTGSLVGSSVNIVGHRDLNRPVSALVHIDPNTRKLRCSLSNAYHDSVIEVLSVETTFLSARGRTASRTPLGQVGLIAADPMQVPKLLRDMIENYAHYRRTAEEFSNDWFHQHDPRRTVAELVENSATATEVARRLEAA